MYDLLIIGAGPSGLNCAIAAIKEGLSYVVLEKGVLVNSIYRFPTNMSFFSTSKNLEVGDVPFISHVDKPTRKEALEYYRRLAEFYTINIHYKQRVTEVTPHGKKFEIKTLDTTYQAKNVVIATGFYDHANQLNVPGEDLPKVKHYYDDAHPYIGMDVVVVGAANSACDVALETWQKGANVTMVIRGESLYKKVKYWILPNIENRIKEGSIKAYFNATITQINETSVDIEQNNNTINIANDYVLAMTGYHPDYTFLKSVGVSLDKATKIPSHDINTLESNVPSVYLAGVVLGGKFTSKYFIENTREQGEKIISAIKAKYP